MEPSINEAEGRLAPLKKVTPLSKYLAMTCFIILPFLGGWIGYNYAPDKDVYVEEMTTVNQKAGMSIETGDNTMDEGNQNKALGSGVATRVMMETETGYPSIRKYTFDNGVYSVSFDLDQSQAFYDNYTDPQIDELGRGTYQGVFVERTYNEEADPPTITERKDFSIDVFHSGYCYLSLCEYETKDTVSLKDINWEYLGATKYCDAGHCGGAAHVYRRSLGQYVVYLKSEEVLTNETLSASKVGGVVDSLVVDLK